MARQVGHDPRAGPVAGQQGTTAAARPTPRRWRRARGAAAAPGHRRSRPAARRLRRPPRRRSCPMGPVPCAGGQRRAGDDPEPRHLRGGRALRRTGRAAADVAGGLAGRAGGRRLAGRAGMLGRPAPRRRQGRAAPPGGVLLPAGRHPDPRPGDPRGAGLRAADDAQPRPAGALAAARPAQPGLHPPGDRPAGGTDRPVGPRARRRRGRRRAGRLRQGRRRPPAAHAGRGVRRAGRGPVADVRLEQPGDRLPGPRLRRQLGWPPASGTEMAQRALALRPEPDAAGRMPDPRTRDGHARPLRLRQRPRRVQAAPSRRRRDEQPDGPRRRRGRTGLDSRSSRTCSGCSRWPATRRCATGSRAGWWRCSPTRRPSAACAPTARCCPAAVEEMLRWWTPVMHFRRTADGRHRAGRRNGSGPATRSSSGSPPPTATPPSSPTPTPSTPPAPPTSTCPSATARTSASAPTWPGCRCGPCSRPSSTSSARSNRPASPSACGPTSRTASSRCRCAGRLCHHRDISSVAAVWFLCQEPEPDCNRETDLVWYRRRRHRPGPELDAAAAPCARSRGRRPAAAGGSVVKIGFVAPLSGPFASAGEDMRRGFRLYLDRHEGRLGGRKVDRRRGRRGCGSGDRGAGRPASAHPGAGGGGGGDRELRGRPRRAPVVHRRSCSR